MVYPIVTLIMIGHITSGCRGESDRHQPRLRYVRSEDCRNEIIHLMDGLTKTLPRAVRMHRSSSGYPLGLMHGNNRQLSDYDDCNAVHSPDVLPRGKCCVLRDRVSPGFSNDFDLNPCNSFLDRFGLTADPTIHSGVCIPESCSPGDVSTHGGFIRDTTHSFGFNTTVELSCTAPKTSNIGENVVWGVVLVSFSFVALSTVCDVLDVDTLPAAVVRSFSLRRNLGKLVRRTESEFDTFHGMKVLSMMMIILGHRCMTSFGSPLFNPEFLEEGYRSFPTIFLLNGFLIVDTFFLIGGFLTFATLHQAHKKGTEVRTLTVFINRWLRITPGYMLMVLFYGYAFDGLGSGPLWSAKVGREAERCRLNWWTNLLYINNYINADKLCMFQSWYVACDMHYTLISPVIVALVTRSGKRGFLILITSITAFSAAVSAVTYINEYDGVMRIHHSALQDIANDKFFSEIYIKSHHRIIPYLSGMTSAYIYLHLKETDYKLSKMILWMSSVVAVIFALTSICGAWVFYIPGRTYNPLENALYASLHRVFWSVSMGWVAVASSRRSFGKLQSILAAKVYLPFSRLSYSVFLVHGAVQLYTTASLRESEYMSYPKLFWMTGGDIVLSFIFALALHLLVEAPMKGMQEILFYKR